MAINKKLISFATQAQFDAYLANNNIDPRSIVFIEDKKRIWTHGVFFDTSWNYVTGKPTTFTPSAHTLGSHSDVTITTSANGDILKYDGSKWINNTLAQAGIASTDQLNNYLPLAGGTLSNSQSYLSGNSFSGILEIVNTSIGVSGEEIGPHISFKGLRGASDTGAYAVYGAIGAINTAPSGTSGGALVFLTKNANGAAQTPTEQMRIATGGNVGIGTTSPAYKLDVAGTGRFTGNVTAPTFIGALTGLASLNLPLTGGTLTGTVIANNPITEAVIQKTSASGLAVLRMLSTGQSHDKGLGLSLSGDLIFGDWSGVSSLSSTWNKVWHSGNLANGTTSQYIRGDGSLATYSDTTYSAMSVAEGIAGTATSLRTMRADYLKQIIQHYDTNSVTGIRAGASETTTNSTATNPYIKVIDDNTYRSQIRLVGSGATTVSSDASGNITISSTDSNTTYSTGTLAQLNAGTDTTGRLQTAKLLNDWLNPKLDGKLDKSGGTLTGNLGSVENTMISIGHNIDLALVKKSGAGGFMAVGANRAFIIARSNNAAISISDTFTPLLTITGNNATFTGNVTAPTFVGALSGNASSATLASTLTINSSASASWFNILWNSGTTVYGAASNKLRVQPSTGSITSGGTITANGGNSNQWNSAYGWGNHALAGYVKGGGHFKAIDIPQTSTGSYQERVILLLPYVSTNTSHTNFINGEITALKEGGNVIDFFKIRGNCVWNSNLMQIESSGQRSNHKLVTCMYNGVKWIALKIGYTANPHMYFRFYGNHSASSALDVHNDALRVISYYDVSAGTALVEEINNSIEDFTPSFDSFLNGNKLYHTGNLTSLSQLTDNIGVATHIANKSNPHNVTKAQVGLGNVDNTADSAKNVLSATKLTTARTIWGQSFNGEGNVSGALSGATTGSFSSTLSANRIVVTSTSNEKHLEFSRSDYNYITSKGHIGFITGGAATGSANQQVWIHSNGNTKIGAGSSSVPAYTLDVNGTGRFIGNVTAPTFVGALTGNASSATKLQTARTINGTNFDGSANITTANWGTARNIGIVNSDGTGTAVTTSVNGSANVNLKLPSTIKASLTGNATTSTTATYLTRAGTSITTAPATHGLRFDTQVSSSTTGIFPTSNNSNAVITLNRHSGNYDSQLGFSSNGNIYYRAFNNTALNTTQAWRTVWDSGNISPVTTNTTQTISGAKTFTGNVLIKGAAADSPLRVRGIDGYIDSTGLLDNLYLNYVSTKDVVMVMGGGNVGIGTTSPAYKLDVSGTGRFTGNVTAPTFIGNLTGLASLNLPLAGGTMTGILKAQNNTSYTTKQVRNIILSPNPVDSSAMGNGDIWITYE